MKHWATMSRTCRIKQEATESVNMSWPGRTPELYSLAKKWISNYLWCTYVTWNVTWYVSKSTELFPCVHRREKTTKMEGFPGIIQGYTFKIDQSNDELGEIGAWQGELARFHIQDLSSPASSQVAYGSTPFILSSIGENMVDDYTSDSNSSTPGAWDYYN